MTLPTIVSTCSGSRPPMRASVRGCDRISHYPRRDPVEACAAAWRVKPSTAGQRLKLGAPECPWTLAAIGTEALIRADQPTRAEALCLPLDLVRVTVCEPVTPETFAGALEAEQEAEGAQTVAQLFIGDAASYLTWRKRAARHIAALKRAFRVGDALYGVCL